VDAFDNFYIADYSNSVIRKVPTQPVSLPPSQATALQAIAVTVAQPLPWS